MMFRRWLACALAFAVAIAAFAAGPREADAAPTNGKFGFATGYSILTMSDAEMNVWLDGMAATGAGYIRFDFSWGYIQSGGSTSYNWAQTDRVVDAAIAKGFKILPVVSHLPGWAGTPSTMNATHFQNFSYQLGLRYIPKGIVDWELWNEANIQGFSPANYVNKILIPGSNGIRQAAAQLGKTVTIVTTGLSPAATNGTHWSMLDYVTGIYANGGKTYFDAVGVHPYTWPHDPKVMTNWNWLKKTPELYDVMVANGDGHKKLWVTEMGYPTNSGTNGISEALQAQYIQDAYDIWKAFSFAGGPYLMYSYKDLGTDPNNPEHYFGIVRYDGTLKPSHAAVTAMIANHPPGGGSGGTEYFRIQNRWKDTQFLYDGGTRVNYGGGAGDAYLWSLESYGGYTRIKNKATGEYINIKNGATNVESTAIAASDVASHWTIASSSATTAAKSVRSASNNNYLNNEAQLGYVTADRSTVPSDTAWYSEQWLFVPDQTATVYYKIQNRWKDTQFLYDGGTRVNYGNGTGDAYLWSLESYGGYTRIRNKATGEYIHIKNGATNVESTAIAASDAASHWTIASSSATTAAKSIRSASNNNYVNNETQLGYVTADRSTVPSDTAWASEQWFFVTQ
jgi:hypothetical protein